MSKSNVNILSRVSSTTYADVLGLQLGLDRLPGELAESYVKRLEVAGHLRREHSYEGALNEISLQLGFQTQVYITMELADAQIINISIAGIVIGATPIIPLLTFDLDNVWRWRQLSDVVADINLITPATLMVDDGPALQIARQTNNLWSFSEDASATQMQLQNTNIQVGSEYFDQPVPAYTLTPNGLLTFNIAPPNRLKITYNYIVAPYDIVGSPVAMIGFTDPEFAEVAATDVSDLSYQVREFLQTIMLQDRSYWSR